MITMLDDLPEGLDGFRASGLVTRDDYEAAVVPVLDRAAADGRRLRVLCVLEPGFEGVTPDAMWEDLSLGVRALPLFDGCAVVSDSDVVRLACRTMAPLLPYSLRVFGSAALSDAVGWLTGLPSAGFSVELRESDGVAVVRAERPLRSADFDMLGRALDRWFDEHSVLTGLVLSAPLFPWWENLAGLLRHAAFVLERHRRIRRVALAIDGLAPALAPFVAGAVLHPSVRQFHHADLDEAIAWAAAATEPVPAGL